MLEDFVRPEIRALEAYVPGRSIEEIRQEYGIEKVIKMASNENPLGTSPLVQEVLSRHAGEAFRYPAGGNPRLVKAIARYLPELTPDFTRIRRRELLDADGRAFR